MTCILNFIINYITKRVKLDILKLRNVTELEEEITEINKLYGLNMTLEDIPLDDSKTWDAFCRCDTKGVFQFSSPVALPVLKKMQCRNIEELSAANSFIRPGTGGLDDYVNGKKDPSIIKKLDPRLDKHLSVTYGAIVFQEQVMSLIAELMGISFGKADIYRRALEKMNKTANKAKVDYFNDNVVEIATKRGFKPEEAEYIRKMIIDNCGYLFNKSHAVCYSLISYYTCWMKVNYPLIFHKTMLNGNMDAFGEFMDQAKEDNVVVMPPDVNKSQYTTIIEDEKNRILRTGFNVIKGIGGTAVDFIVENRPYATINEFFEKNNSKATNKKVVEALISSGSFDKLPLELNSNVNKDELINSGYVLECNMIYLDRKKLIAWYENYLNYASQKSIPNYEVNLSKIKQKYIEIYEIVAEKGTQIVVIPEPLLDILDLTIEDGVKSRKRPKGKIKELLDSQTIIMDPFSKALVKHPEIASIEINQLELYLEESDLNGFSFLPHPLEKYSQKITNYKHAMDGDMLVEAGIITGMVERKTQNNKKYYWMFLKTPLELLRITLWDNQYKQNKDIIKQFGLVAIKGKKGFGGMSMEMIKSLNV